MQEELVRKWSWPISKKPSHPSPSNEDIHEKHMSGQLVSNTEVPVVV
jgi:hypothetical protein